MRWTPLLLLVLSCQSVPPPSSPIRRYDDRLMELRQAICTSVREVLPRFSRPAVEMGKAFPDLGELLEKALKVASDSEKARLTGDRIRAEKSSSRLLRARMALERRDPDWAIHHAKLAEGADAFLIRCEASLLRFQKSGDDADAVRARQAALKVIELGRNDALSRTALGLALMANRDYEGALVAVNEAIELDPDYAVALNNRSVLYRLRDEIDKAIRDCTEAIRINPRLATALINRGAMYEQLGEYKKALADYEKAIVTDPGLAQAHFTWALLQIREKRNEVAIAGFTEAIRLEPEFFHAYHFRGTVKDSGGNLEGAVADYTEALRIRPRFTDAWYARGIAHYQDQKLDKAQEDFTGAIGCDPKYVPAYVARASVRQNRGDKAGAIADYEEALRMAEKDWPHRKQVQGMLDRLKGR